MKKEQTIKEYGIESKSPKKNKTKNVLYSVGMIEFEKKR